jgi:hypothetical protein
LGDVIGGLVRFVLRVVFFLMGLLFAASVLVAVLFIALAWSLRALWARITGKPVTPWVMRMDPRAGFRRFYEAAAPAEPEPTAGERAAARALGGGDRRADVTDVQPREPGSRD